MTSADKAIRYSTIAAVAIVALVAAFVSYRHALQVVRLHGEGWPVAQLYPLTIDGLIYAASMVLLDAARRRAAPPVLAYAALGLGIAATLAANVAAGLVYGPAAAVIAAWPAPALVISYELLMFLVRTSATPRTGDQTTAARVAATSAEAARLAYAASAEAASPLSERALADRFGIPRTQAKKIRAELNGSGHV
jgi:hypothetical protein